MTMNAEDYQAIKNLIYRYCALVDAGALDEMGRLFSHALVEYQEGARFNCDPDGVATLASQWMLLYTDQKIPLTRHISTNVIIEATGKNEASACSSVLIVQAAPKIALQPVAVGHYDDRFKKVRGKWCFSYRSVVLDLVGDLSQHLLKQL